MARITNIPVDTLNSNGIIKGLSLELGINVNLSDPIDPVRKRELAKYPETRNSVKIVNIPERYNEYLGFYTMLDSNIKIGDIVYISSFDDATGNIDTFYERRYDLNFPYVKDNGYKVIYVDSNRNLIIINKKYEDLPSNVNLTNHYISLVKCENITINDGYIDAAIIKECDLIGDVNVNQGIFFVCNSTGTTFELKYDYMYPTLVNTEDDILSLSISKNNNNNGYSYIGCENSISSNIYITNIESGIYYNGVFNGSNHIISGGYFEECVISDYIITGGYFKNCTVENNCIWSYGTWEYDIGEDYSLLSEESQKFGPSVWYDGIWNNGIFGYFNSSKTWLNGIFNDGYFYRSNWTGGTFNDGTFVDSQWYNGVFNNGNFNADNIDCMWSGGTFNGGDMSGDLKLLIYYYKIYWYDGTFNNGNIINYVTWYDGIFNNGAFKGSGSTWNNGIWNNGIFETGTWYDGVWYGGTFNNGGWRDGSWYNGKMINSTWSSGTWYQGEFNNSTWSHGTWKNGKFFNSETENIYDPILGMTGTTNTIWENGIAENSDIIYADWKNGSSTKTNIFFSRWSGGTFNDGYFWSGDWYNGTFINGKFYLGNWYNGIWNKGYWVLGENKITGDNSIPNSSMSAVFNPSNKTSRDGTPPIDSSKNSL